MKTTVEIADGLLGEVRKVAAREGTTVRALVEEGLRKALDSRRKVTTPFRLRFATFRGDGLLSQAEGGWERLREMIYEGRGT